MKTLCKVCGRRALLDIGDLGEETALRASGWVVWRGETLGSTGTQVIVVLCPGCATGIPRQRVPKDAPLVGQEELF